VQGTQVVQVWFDKIYPIDNWQIAYHVSEARIRLKPSVWPHISVTMHRFQISLYNSLYREAFQIITQSIPLPYNYYYWMENEIGLETINNLIKRKIPQRFSNHVLVNQRRYDEWNCLASCISEILGSLNNKDYCQAYISFCNNKKTTCRSNETSHSATWHV